MMKTLAFSIIFISLTGNLYAQAKDIRISSNSGRILDISSTGQLSTSATNSPGTSLPVGAKDIRISDADGDVLNINADGSINIVAV